ncbi:hypothetical protein SAMN05518866_1415 [Sphingobium sp. YR768]|nr:hypothetical protein SAMN05518866_1415 [Sphingobium sp. YR768]
MWTDSARAQYACAGLTMPSDLTYAEWSVLEPFLPPPARGPSTQMVAVSESQVDYSGKQLVQVLQLLEQPDR